MPDPGVPSPQEELRAEIIAAIDAHPATPKFGQEYVATAVLPLFAARVAAIEAERDHWHKMRDAYFESSRQEQQRAEKAEAELSAVEGRVAAERTQAAIWPMGCRCHNRSGLEDHQHENDCPSAEPSAGQATPEETTPTGGTDA